MPLSPILDVVIPVHNPQRPVERAVRSVLNDAGASLVRVTVVAHEIDPAQVDRVDDARVRVISHRDGRRSAAGPMNAGLSMATAPYVCRLDSDDTWEAGALDAWLPALEKGKADVVIPRLRVEGRPDDRNPLTRPGRRRRLDPVADRLASRTGVFGPVRREYLTVTGASYDTQLEVGEDLEFGLRLYFGGGRIDGVLREPGVMVRADGIDRVTHQLRTVDEELRAVATVAQSPWTRGLSPAAREAIAIKLLRIHVLGALRTRATGQGGALSAGDQDSVRLIMGHLTQLSPTAPLLLTRSEWAEIDRCLGAQVRSAGESRWGHLTRPAYRSFHRHSVLRRYVLLRVKK